VGCGLRPETAWSLRNRRTGGPEGTHQLRHLQTPTSFYGLAISWADLAVADLSFISLAPGNYLPLRRLLVAKEAEAVVRSKPQFEVGKARVRQGGVVAVIPWPMPMPSKR